MPLLSTPLADDLMLSRYAHRLARHAPHWILDEDDLYQIGALARLHDPSPWAVWRDMVDALRKAGRSVRAVRQCTLLLKTQSEMSRNAISAERLAEIFHYCEQAKPIEQDVLRALLDGDTLAECGVRIGRTEGRVSQIRAKLKRELTN